ncbi:MAG: hypothetical protein IGS39_19080 [Calothrix sp. C42_A2020_038]|nr:hypothetical protein [Calothrix sp. C42_A2020_038]
MSINTDSFDTLMWRRLATDVTEELLVCDYDWNGCNGWVVGLRLWIGMDVTEELGVWGNGFERM